MDNIWFLQAFLDWGATSLSSPSWRPSCSPASTLVQVHPRGSDRIRRVARMWDQELILFGVATPDATAWAYTGSRASASPPPLPGMRGPPPLGGGGGRRGPCGGCGGGGRPPLPSTVVVGAPTRGGGWGAPARGGGRGPRGRDGGGPRGGGGPVGMWWRGSVGTRGHVGTGDQGFGDTETRGRGNPAGSAYQCGPVYSPHTPPFSPHPSPTGVPTGVPTRRPRRVGSPDPPPT